mmetsp:Transcript_53845/g.64991  ORF Transcript_53845/g.64991 Transcript_53845/m.64991 type:complete len:602 (-) Transcript_53845:93-1898(-)|eukprot:CAMPEP_0172507292 /NCGR_PEP_ID=MMETSP1066-20121228/202756_1 /TAXON_ID=671091 /ORGANISM="Coscinodiscus wailesii, Strain CCMP2513" /LENGTH=601 /DNA_ID=CAMNT_0013284795 /DNA_START=125 /DNA_END=1930 /DNA_ORIENTATION=+
MGNNRRNSFGAKDQTRVAIERMEAEREARRQAAKDRRQERAQEEQRNIAAGNPGDIDFISLVRQWRSSPPQHSLPLSATPVPPKICICVRKRPLNDRERRKKDHDSVTCLHPTVWVHSAKLRVDGITKYLDHGSFRFDYAFDEDCSTEDVYKYSTLPLIDFVCSGKGGRATVFAYGQTGSGKTHTMEGIQNMVAEDVFLLLNHSANDCCHVKNTHVTVSFFELYGGRIQDLLNHRQRLKLLEDGKGEVVISGLEEFEANDTEELMSLISAGNRNRTTHATECNDSSSRSHAICQLSLRDKASSRLRGKLSLVDLAGSERGSDTKSHNRQRRTESSEINKSLLALKECIRALDNGRGTGAHVPYRASKLTLILKDCFTSASARTTMIATVSPAASSADHTTNTLRYADRVKEKKVGDPTSTPDHSTKSKTKKHPPSRSPQRRPLSSRSPRLNQNHHTPRRAERMTSPATTSSNPFPAPKDIIPDDIEDLPFRDEAKETQKNEAEHHRTVQDLFEQEENLLNLHMSVIQENAELLTEEGKLLHSVQGDDVVDYDIDQYASRLGTILDRKTHLITRLQDKLNVFRTHLKKEEELSKKLGHMPEY